MNKKIVSALYVSFVVVSTMSTATVESGCLSSPSQCLETRYGYTSVGMFDAYEFDESRKFTTSKGVMVDPAGLKISAALVDRLVDEVESCLKDNFPNGELPQDVTDKIGSKSASFNLPIDRSEFKVRVAADWLLSCDGKQQVLPILADPKGCVAKGFTPTAECPCRWRAGINCPNTIVTTPNFFLFKDALLRFILDSSNPWGHPTIARCATPSTKPLSDGSNM
jgi:hypothetical protein